MNQTAYLKLGIQGFEGSGKTFLACHFAMGMSKLTNNPKVAYFDSEKGSDFWVKKFAEQNIQLDVLRSRSFSDLLTVMHEAEQGNYAFLIIDSITHVWRDLSEAYLAKAEKKRLSMNDWMVLKSQWGQFTKLFVNSKLHIGMCGRAGYEYDFDEDESGKKEIVKTGTKMKAEGETGFEPDLLIETFKVQLSETLTDRKKKKASKGFINRCCVIKDRSDSMNGKIIDRPKFEDFLSVVKILNLGGEHSGPKSIQSTTDMFDAPDRLWAEIQKLQAIALEQIKEILILANLDGTSAEAKRKRTEKLIEAFGTSAWTAISSMDLETLNRGIGRLASLIEKSITTQEPCPEESVIDMKHA
jgi:hypothetical protein